MGYLETLRMKLKKPIAKSNQQFELAVFNDTLDKIDTLAGVTWVADVAGRPTTNLYDGRFIVQRDNMQFYVWDDIAKLWKFAVIAATSQSLIPFLTIAQRNALNTVNSSPLLVDKMLVFNTTTKSFETYELAVDTWWSAAPSVKTGKNRYDAQGNLLVEVFADRSTTVGAVGNFQPSNAYQQYYFHPGTNYNASRLGAIWQVSNGNMFWFDTRSQYTYFMRMSSDGGATWIDSAVFNNTFGADSSFRNSFSWFLDNEENIWIVGNDNSSTTGQGVLWKGTLNGAKTAYSWTLTALNSSQMYNCYSVMVVKLPSGNYHINIVCATNTSGSATAVRFQIELTPANGLVTNSRTTYTHPLSSGGTYLPQYRQYMVNDPTNVTNDDGGIKHQFSYYQVYNGSSYDIYLLKASWNGTVYTMNSPVLLYNTTGTNNNETQYGFYRDNKFVVLRCFKGSFWFIQAWETDVVSGVTTSRTLIDNLPQSRFQVDQASTDCGFAYANKTHLYLVYSTYVTKFAWADVTNKYDTMVMADGSTPTFSQNNTPIYNRFPTDRIRFATSNQPTTNPQDVIIKEIR